MARIMCTHGLLRALERPHRAGVDPDRSLVRGTVLGDWAATVARIARRDLVLALNERTYLTLVFPLFPRGAFRSNFAAALGEVLEDHHVSREIAVREGAEVEVARLVRLRDRSLVTAIDNVEFICSVEMGYDDDLRRVQARLNEFPHPNRHPGVPTEAVILLFAALAGSRRRGDRDVAAARATH